MKKSDQTDPLQARCLELCSEAEERLQALRDYATTPGNAWLAKGELQQLGTLLSQLESLLEEIKRADADNQKS